MSSNGLTRRGFFRTILAAIATSTLLTSPAVADAIEQFPDDKIAQAVRLARAVITAKEDVREDSYINVIDYMNTHFDPKAVTIQDAKLVISDPAALGLRGDLLDEDDLQRLLDGIVPIVVMRSLIAIHRVRAPKIVESRVFHQFAENYVKTLIPHHRA